MGKHTQYEIVEAIGGCWIVLCNGFQWGKGPLDLSGCSSQTWATKAEAQAAIDNAHKA